MIKMKNPTISVQPPTTFEIERSGGLKGLLINLPNCPAMHFELSFRAGDYRCPSQKPDLAHFLEHLVLMANKQYPSQRDFARAVRANGAYCNASTGPKNVRYFFSTPTNDWQRAFDLMLTAASQPLFLLSEFESEKEVVRQEWHRQLNNRQATISYECDQRVGFEAFLPAERLAGLDSISRADVRAYYRRTHTIDNARLMLAGPMPPAHRRWVLKRLEQLSLPAGRSGRPTLPREKLNGAGLIYKPDPTAETVYYQLTFVNNTRPPGRSDLDALGLIRNLLIDSDDSWIYGQARELGLIYALGAGYGATVTSGHFGFYGQVTPVNLEPLIDLILNEIDRLLAGEFEPDEVDRCKDRLSGTFDMSYLTPQSWVGYYAHNYLNRDFVIPSYRSRLRPIDRDQMIQTARHIFGPANWTLGLLGKVPQATRRRLETRFKQRQTQALANRSGRPSSREGE